MRVLGFKLAPNLGTTTAYYLIMLLFGFLCMILGYHGAFALKMGGACL